jgi:hypothetical protein
MALLHALLSKIQARLTRPRRDAELAEEVEAHLAMLAAGYMARGMSAAEANLAARKDFGAVEPMKQINR